MTAFCSENTVKLKQDINFQDFEKELSNPLQNTVLRQNLLCIYDTVPAGCITLNVGRRQHHEMKNYMQRSPTYSIGKILCDAVSMKKQKDEL